MNKKLSDVFYPETIFFPLRLIFFCFVYYVFGYYPGQIEKYPMIKMSISILSKSEEKKRISILQEILSSTKHFFSFSQVQN